MQTAQEITSVNNVNNSHLSAYELTHQTIKNLNKYHITPVAKLVLVLLTTHYNQARNGAVVFPSMPYIADTLGIGLTATKKAIKDLIEAGLIIKAKRDKVRGNCNKYLLTQKVQKATIKQPENDRFKRSKNDRFMLTNNNKLNKQQITEVKPPEKKEAVKVVSFNSVLKEDIPELLKQNKNIKNLTAYWASLSAEVKADYIEKQKQQDHKAQIKEQQKLETQRYIAEVTDFSKAVDPKTLDCWRLLGDKLKKDV